MGGIDPISDERASYYGADDKLLAVDWRVVGNKKVEEFRYDPLGRRVWVRYIPTCSGPGGEIGCVIPSVRRTIWDGTQELAEISAPADTTTPATEELDQGFPVLNYVAGAGPYGDPNPHYGRVVYSPGLAVDQPLSVTRYEYHDKPTPTAPSLSWPRFSLMVFWDYRGAPAYGLFTDGAWAKPHTMGTGQTTCPGIGVATTERCVLFQWPMAQSAYDRNRGRISFPVWHGSILQNKRSGTGLEYMRNRMYDPGTGRFTQEDPIGLAGGLNLYGFANGDPVNFSDPFGLCPPVESCRLLELLRASGEQRMVIGRIPTGPRTVGGYQVNVRRETTVQLEQSRTTGNALITAVGEVEISNVFGPVDATLIAGAYDVGTQSFEAHGSGPLGRLLTPVHVRGNAKQGVTGACILVCFPVPEKKKADDKTTTPQ